MPHPPRRARPCTSSPLAQPLQGGQLSPPPRHLAGLERREAVVEVSYEGIEGIIGYDMTGKSVLLRWRRDFRAHLPETRTPSELTMDGWFVSSQLVPMQTWPTEACGFGRNRLCVASKTPIGTTRIEVWTLGEDADLGDAHRDQGGVWHYPRTTIPVASMQTVYEGNQTGKRLVRCMFQNLGSPQRLFVQFDDARDLLELDTRTGTFTTILTVSQQPLLAPDFEDRWSAHHELGYMYNLIAPGKGGILALFDSDCDGTLDPAGTRHFVGDQWYAGPVDFSDPSKYRAFH